MSRLWLMEFRKVRKEYQHFECITMIDREMLVQYKAELRDRYTAVELCEMLELTEDDILEMFEDRVVEFKFR